jgi:hypothetical protein
MRINEGHLSGKPIDRQHDIDPALGSGASERPASEVSQFASDYSSLRELARLAAAVNETEEIRPGLVQEVSRRLVAGAYVTREAAEHAAEAILQVADQTFTD